MKGVIKAEKGIRKATNKHNPIKVISEIKHSSSPTFSFTFLTK